MTSTEMEQYDPGQLSMAKAVVLFVVAFAVYFLTHSPALDEIDAVQFAMGVRSFDLWRHQPHPPGYPLFIFLGWVGTKLFYAGTESSLYCVSALAGGLFVAAWFSIIRLQFSERLAWWVAPCLLITPVVWMTATKVLTDMLAAGLMSAELLAAICFVEQKKRGLMVWAALLGAAAAGARPQLFPVVAMILGIPLKKASVNVKTWLFAYAVLVAGCLTWLLPMWYMQFQLRPSEPFWRVYPELAYSQWRRRLDQPSIYIGAGDWSPHYLGVRFASHILGWFSKGFGFIQSPRVLVAGIVLTACAAIAYLLRYGREAADKQFWKFHCPWLLIHIAIIFAALPGAQRYYLMVFPPLLVIMLRGFLRLPKPWNLSAICVPALLVYIVVPLAIENHRDESPPVRLVRYLEKLYPPWKRGDVVLILPTTRRSAQWYAPQFKIVDHVPTSEDQEVLSNAAVVYTEDPSLKLKDSYLIEVAKFRRSVLIFPQHHRARLYLVERRRSS